jgi:hypothetical protein
MNQTNSRPKYASDATRSERRRAQKQARLDADAAIRRARLHEWQQQLFDMLLELDKTIERCRACGPDYQSIFSNLLDERRVLSFITSMPMTIEQAVYAVALDGAWEVSDISHEVKVGIRRLHPALANLIEWDCLNRSGDLFQPITICRYK